MNQIDIPEYQYHLDCNAKGMVRVTFLEKSLYFIRKCRLIRLSNQTRYGESHGHLNSKTRRIFAIACLGKKFVFQSEISTYSNIIRLFYFEKYSILSGQEVVQIKPNSVWSIPWAPRV